MTDRDLLELAAKAAGIDGDFGSAVNGFIPIDPDDDGNPQWWNPLTDDGDALRLAVRLCLLVPDVVEDWEWCRTKKEHSDICANYRQAIVRAAAEIGKNLDTR